MSICENICDENTKVAVQAMLRDIKSKFKTLLKLIKKIKSTPKNIIMDKQNGLETLENLA